MRRSSATATAVAKATTGTASTVRAPIDSAKARFFYQGMFALKKLQQTNKSKSPVKKPVTATTTASRR